MSQRQGATKKVSWHEEISQENLKRQHWKFIHAPADKLIAFCGAWKSKSDKSGDKANLTISPTAERKFDIRTKSKTGLGRKRKESTTVPFTKVLKSWLQTHDEKGKKKSSLWRLLPHRYRKHSRKRKGKSHAHLKPDCRSRRQLLGLRWHECEYDLFCPFILYPGSKGTCASKEQDDLVPRQLEEVGSSAMYNHLHTATVNLCAQGKFHLLWALWTTKSIFSWIFCLSPASSVRFLVEHNRKRQNINSNAN